MIKSGVVAQMMSLKILSKIHNKTKLSVYGWIRKEEKTLKIPNIPSLVSAICILYYREDEIFNIISDKCIKLSGNKKTITKTDYDLSLANNNYGIVKIRSKGNNTIYTWKLKMHFVVKCYYNAVGIASKISPNQQMEHINDAVHYMVHGDAKRSSDDQCSKNYGKTWKNGDELSMTLDMGQSEMRLSINGEDQGIAFTNIKKSKDIEYRLFISLYSIKDCVEILEFTKK